MWLLIREASAARNLQALLPLVARVRAAPDRVLHRRPRAGAHRRRRPHQLDGAGRRRGRGRARGRARARVAQPRPLARAAHLGALAPGYQADLLLLPDLERFEPELVLKAGRPVDEIAAAEVPDWVRHTVRIAPRRPRPTSASPGTGGSARVIGLVPDQIVTDSLVEEPTVVDGDAVADPERDLAKIAVLERHLGTGRIGLGFVRGFGLKTRRARLDGRARRAQHRRRRRRRRRHGARRRRGSPSSAAAIVVVEDGGVRAELPLPIAGLLSDAPLDGGRRIEPRAASRRRASSAASLRGAVPDARVPRALRDPER